MTKRNKPSMYDGRTSISVNWETYGKFQAYCKDMNMTVSDVFNIMMLACVSTEKLESLFDNLIDKIIAVKMKDKT